jgi:hypothetical protein
MRPQLFAQRANAFMYAIEYAVPMRGSPTMSGRWLAITAPSKSTALDGDFDAWFDGR